ncbi:hypothetical protein DIZ81_02990 [Legionella taurinensis]|uniref:Uncharacterized protein n=1 Tax=Legionella taurinensis TaxID=70611 RepID=A0AB38ND12_9GAMM|nr:hypothetical protein [Legionella taurinensis]MDX1836160.1 hypothetical protein [Legionella taurinensis]PUT42070.1 hypothetical protein DB744_02995 [Legionella taurinensis]PUT44857.1 hypothetical protein DB746_02995 [Legionella taurinensis]PUT48178.1 hypothetical protein DB743_01155 [Legionella taurinensis]PUT48992.1 hypothetical protein DB745_02995 [Legionella taurinensis]
MPDLSSLGSTVNHKEWKDDIFSWWKKEKHPTLTGRFFPSYQTRLLDKSINEFSVLLASKKEELKQKKLSALKMLRTQILNWQYMHLINKLSSHRHKVIKKLLKKVDEEIQTTEDASVNKAKAKPNPNPLRLMQSLDREQPVLSFPSSGETLYSWWKKHSHLHWLTWRSDATKELDKAIRWYSNSIIIDQQKALQQILHALDVWLYARNGLSSRQSRVLELKSRIEETLTSLQGVDEEREAKAFSFNCHE